MITWSLTLVMDVKVCFTLKSFNKATNMQSVMLIMEWLCILITLQQLILSNKYRQHFIQ